MIRHAGLVAMRLGGRWRGVLVEGPSGAGKSDLALRTIGLGPRLVADDRVLVFVSSGRLYGKAPAPLAGLLEARGVGIVSVPPLEFAEIVLLVRCKGSIERMPGPEPENILGVAVPVIDITPFEVSAPAKLILALRHLGAGAQQGYQALFASLDGRVGP